MSQSGFNDAAVTRGGASDDRGDGTRGRPRVPVLFLFLLLGAAVLAFGAWAWAKRVQADDLAAYDAVVTRLADVDRNYLPIGETEHPPCSSLTEGWIERQFPQSTGPSVDELAQTLATSGWEAVPEGQQKAGSRTFTQVFLDHVATAVVATQTGGAGGTVLTIHTAANSLACRAP